MSLRRGENRLANGLHRSGIEKFERRFGYGWIESVSAIWGDCHGVGEGVQELRINYGPGYRVYFAQEGVTVVLLLCGGDKSTQTRDIETAKRYWNDYRRRL